MASFDISDYNTVPERIAEFRAKYPEGSLAPADPNKPFEVVKIGEQTFIVVVSAAYRTPDDRCPGVGQAWEPFPGKTPYTRDSELMNAETSSWGRAIVAALAADTRKGIATQDEIRNRQHAPPAPVDEVTQEQINDLNHLAAKLGDANKTKILEWAAVSSFDEMTGAMASAVIQQWTKDVAAMEARKAAKEAA